MCTGYLHSYPFLREELRLKSKNVLYPPGLYKGIVWQEGGNNKLLYCGVQDQYYTYTMFDVVGLWAVKLIEGEISLPDADTMDKDWKKWVARNKTLKDCYQEIDFQTDYVQDITKDCGADYPYNVDVTNMFYEWGIPLRGGLNAAWDAAAGAPICPPFPRGIKSASERNAKSLADDLGKDR